MIPKAVKCIPNHLGLGLKAIKWISIALWESTSMLEFMRGQVLK